MDEILNPDELIISASLWDRMSKFSHKVSPEAAEEFARIGIDTRPTGKVTSE